MTACRNGHTRTEANTYRGPDGKPQCRECRAAARKRRNFDVRASTTAVDLDAAQVRRLRDAWVESEATREELAGRFGVGRDVVLALTAGLRRGAA